MLLTTSQSLRGPRCPQYGMSAPDTTAQIAINAATPNHIRCSLQEAFTIAYALRKSPMASVTTFSRNEPSEGPWSLIGLLRNRLRLREFEDGDGRSRRIPARGGRFAHPPASCMIRLLAEMESRFMSFLWRRSISRGSKGFPCVKAQTIRPSADSPREPSSAMVRFFCCVTVGFGCLRSAAAALDPESAALYC